MSDDITLEKLAEMIARGFREMREEINERFDALEERIGALERRVGALERQYDQLHDDVCIVKTTVDRIEKEILSQHERRIGVLESKLEAFGRS